MSNAVDRLKARRRQNLQQSQNLNIYGPGDAGITIHGDEATAKSVGSGLTTGMSAISEIWANQEKAKADKAAAAVLQQAKDAATVARQDAEIKRINAMGEADQVGPLHLAAAQADAKAQLLEQKAGMMPGGSNAALLAAQAAANAKGGQAAKSSSVFTATNIAIGVGVLVVGVLGYKLLTHNSGSSPRGYARRGS